MPIEHPPPTVATIKKLYAHAFGCAFEGCRRPLYRVDDETGVRTPNSRVCHINARREGGPRWDPHQTAEDNRSEDNLVLMCVEHAALIDEPQTLTRYPAELLHQWKQNQLEQYDRIQQGWVLDTDMAKQVIEASQSHSDIAIENSTVSLGGEGGKAPGAGGGGGGAIGQGARGGRGGKGGGHRIDDGDYTLPWTKNHPTHLDMEKLANSGVDYVPGAGGGGADAIGDGAIGGDGGAGGECVSARIDIAKLRKAGFHHIECIVGKGGNAGSDGEDTVLNFVTEDGRILKTIRASGGKGDASTLPEGVVEITPEDVHNNFRITTLLVANAVEIRDGLFFLLGGDWDKFRVPRMPFDAAWPVICTARWQPREWQAPRGIFLSLYRPDGDERFRQALVIPSAASIEGACRWVYQVHAKLDVEGVWTLRLHSAQFLLAHLDIKVELTTPAE